MARPRYGFALLVVFVMALGATPAPASDDGWLLGRWELVHSPEGDKKGWLEFAADGGMISIAPDGRRSGGRYVTTGREVQLNFKDGSRSILITLTYGPDRERLYARSARTGYTAVYEKRQ